MRITVFTSNQPRHRALIEALADIADEVYAVMECTTIHPGLVKDFYSDSPSMLDYFNRVIRAEGVQFGNPEFVYASNVLIFPMKMGDLNALPFDRNQEWVDRACDSDYYVCFGCSYIKGELCDFLIEKKAINIHMGLSPYYRGSGCNFWAMYDRRPQMVGATIHMLSKGLDSGDVIQTVKPNHRKGGDGFSLGMNAVDAAISTLCELIGRDELSDIRPLPQDKSEELRYSRYKDFSDEVVEEYLANMMTPQQIEDALSRKAADA